MTKFMKLLTVLLGIFWTSGTLFAGQQIHDNPSLIVGTNVSCVLLVESWQNPDRILPPVCSVQLSNNSADRWVWCAMLPQEMLFDADLADSDGINVEKTDYGKQFGLSLTQEEANARLLPFRMSRGSFATGFLATKDLPAPIGELSVPKMFKITKPGDYTLRLRMRLVQARFSDPAGTARTNILDPQYLGKNRTVPTVFESVWLPAVSAKVVISTNDFKLIRKEMDSKPDGFSK